MPCHTDNPLSAGMLIKIPAVNTASCFSKWQTAHRKYLGIGLVVWDVLVLLHCAPEIKIKGAFNAKAEYIYDEDQSDVCINLLQAFVKHTDLQQQKKDLTIHLKVDSPVYYRQAGKVKHMQPTPSPPVTHMILKSTKIQNI